MLNRSLILFLSLLLLAGCNTSTDTRSDIPFSETDTYDSVRKKGSKAYTEQYKGWKEAKKRQRSIASKKDDELCDENGIDKKDLSYIKDFINGEKSLREAEGGAACVCRPMGENCKAGACACDEICPNHHGILRGRSEQMTPTKENSLAFINSEDFNGTAYKKYPVTGGFCSGNNAVLRKFQVLSDMRPDLRSWPAMKKGSAKWRKYTLAQIERMGQGQTPEFLGVESMVELCQDKEFVEALKKKGKFSFGENDSSAKDPKFWEWMAESKPMKFTHTKSENIPPRSAIDPDTGKPVPYEGTPEYHNYIKGKVERIAAGSPASLPGHSSIHALSSDPTYMEIMGSQAAVDWKTFNKFEDGTGFHGFSSGQSEGVNKPLEPMKPNQLKTFITQAQSYLPSYPDSYPKGKKPGESWNEDGPFQTLPISIRSTEKSGDTEKHGYHSVEAWAMKPLPPKGLRVCVKDPNHTAGTDDNCQTFIDIPDPEDASTVSYTGFPGRTIGKFNFTGYGLGHMGSMTERLVAYCRRVKTFPEGDKCSK